MRRAARILFNITTSLSLALCLAAIAAGIRSAYRHDIWFVEKRFVSGPNRKVERTEVHSVRWALDFSRLVDVMRPDGRREADIPWTLQSKTGIGWDCGDGWRPPRLSTFSRLAGGLSAVEERKTRQIVSYPILVLVLALLPAKRLITWMRAWTAARAGHCRACGYDLRATPARCPECGTRA